MQSMYIVTFNSTHHAIMFEKMLKDLSLKIRAIPTPREISSSCGLSIAFEELEIENIKEQLNNNNIDYYGIFKITKLDDGKKDILKLY